MKPPYKTFNDLMQKKQGRFPVIRRQAAMACGKDHPMIFVVRDTVDGDIWGAQVYYGEWEGPSAGERLGWKEMEETVAYKWKSEK